MRLSVRTWGSGPRTALLVHGFSDDAQTWWRVGPALAEAGFTVLAPDLRGHGCSPSADSYRLDEFAADLVETLPKGADLAVGHSLGAMALALVSAELAAERTVLVDPAWWRTDLADALAQELPQRVEDLPGEAAAWLHADVAVDLASNARTDVAVGSALAHAVRSGGFDAPASPAGGAVVLVPGLEPLLVREAQHRAERLGYTVRVQPGVRHVVHRDDAEGFLQVLRDEARSCRPAA